MRGLTPPLFFCLNTDKSSITMKPTPKEHNEALDRHAIIVKHLIDEGYADSEESADKIIMCMREQWFNIIID